MMDATNVGISPLMSTPITSYITTPGVQTATFGQPMVYGQSSIPAMPTTYTTQVVDQGFTLPTATTSVIPDATASFIPAATPSYITQPITTTTTPVFPDTGLQTSFVPQMTLPDQPLTSFVPDTTASFVPSSDVQTVSVLPNAGAQSIITSTAPVTVSTPEAILPQTSMVPTSQVAEPPANYSSATVGGTVVTNNQPSASTTGPIMDEDFQRGRPIYDEINEDRYRGFRLGRR
jgi:hypothetical protein